MGSLRVSTPRHLCDLGPYGPRGTTFCHFTHCTFVNSAFRTRRDYFLLVLLTVFPTNWHFLFFTFSPGLGLMPFWLCRVVCIPVGFPDGFISMREFDMKVKISYLIISNQVKAIWL